MATITGTSIITKAATLIQDTTGIRWPRDELVEWLNDGQREVVLLKPEAAITNASIKLSSNQTKQTIPANGITLIDITRNMGTDGVTAGNAIRIVSREVMDAQTPSWHSDTNSLGIVLHYMFDTRDPKTFYVYPKSPQVPWYVEAIISTSPSNTNDTGTPIGIDDIYSNALLDYVLYRAYSKDATYAQNAQLAVAHYQAFSGSLGVKSQIELSHNPNLAVGAMNPNVAGAAKI